MFFSNSKNRHYRDLFFHCFCSLFISLFTCFTISYATEKTITYPRPESDQDLRVNYPVALLRLALQKSGETYKLEAGTHIFMQARALAELESNREIDVVWSMTSIEREERLLPIRIPIYKGLIGWRLLLIQKQQEDLFQKIHKLKQLQPLVAGQGHDWPDTRILRENGLKVYGASSYDGLFKMLVLGRIDYFPRSLIEIWNEYQAFKDEGISIHTGIILQYPTAFYYFVNRENLKLAEDIKRGLERALMDGSFDALFHKEFDHFLTKANLSQQSVFVLKNPVLPPETPLHRQELWYRALPHKE